MISTAPAALSTPIFGMQTRPRETTPRILLVDDEQPILRAYARLLGTSNYIIETATSGAIALEMMDRASFDIIITDLTMPGMSGIDLLRAIRARDRDIPVILVTAAPSTESAVHALEYGALRYLLKPVDRAALGRALDDALALRRIALVNKQAAALIADYGKSVDDRAILQDSLDSALTTVVMAYQPIVSWSQKNTYGYEALVRTSEPRLPHPGALFDAAERLGEVERLGRRIRELVPNPPVAIPDDVSIFVNLHTRDLRDDNLFAADAPLSQIASRVVLEITERASLQAIDDVQGRISALREMGFRIAIDDIGAGYAGLTSFAMLEPEVVKLDMALIRDIDKKPTKQRLVASMVVLCRELNIMLIAEGVETPAERDRLVDLGCDYFQGYLFAKPAPPFSTPKF
jgi:EAL domain-containing protein (putative c-di-GMP-specific phosphodiesterase class I)